MGNVIAQRAPDFQFTAAAKAVLKPTISAVLPVGTYLAEA